MKYMGSKNRISKHILPIMLSEREDGQCWVEPFVGGANIIDKVNGRRIGADCNYYLIEMLDALVNDEWVPNKYISKKYYDEIKNNKEFYEPWLVGWVGFNCSYSGKFFGGYAGEINTKIGTKRNYQDEAHKNVKKQIPNLHGIEFINCSYDELKIPPKSIIYCDPPYENTTGYKDKFNHLKFWQWCRDKAKEGHVVFVSEYDAPPDFKCVWEKEVKSSLSANGKSGSSKNSIEKLFRYVHKVSFLGEE